MLIINLVKLILGIIENNKALLVSINNAVFSGGIDMGKNICIYNIKTIQDLKQIVDEFISRSLVVKSMNIANDWIIVETCKAVEVVVKGIECY